MSYFIEDEEFLAEKKKVNALFGRLYKMYGMQRPTVNERNLREDVSGGRTYVRYEEAPQQPQKK